ncbi:MAG: hypothetical protein ABSD59_06095 [Terracidiphilus sp.]|jgi:uncharacterized protein YqgC (DUF456 family)
MRLASFFYALALLTLEAGPATKVFFGGAEMMWLDPPLIFSMLALIALLPHLNRKNTRLWREVAGPLAALVLVCGLCVLSGFLLRPTDELYNALREPSRFALMLVWFATSCWFLEQRREMVLRYAAAGALLGLLSGIYVYCAAMRLLPAPLALLVYAEQYWIRQALWVAGVFIPRMGGFFIEAPPFGLFMLGLLVFFLIALRSGARSRATKVGLAAALVGTIASLADQVMVAVVVCLAASVLSLRTQVRWLRPFVLGAACCLLAASANLSLQSKLEVESDAPTVIYRESVGERNFHLRYGISLLGQQPSAVVFGIGPGRYGEYASETGLFPDTVTMQYTVPEILVEWGVAGLAVWLGVLAMLGARAWRAHKLAGLGLLLGLLIADSFQANWKSESVFLAVAALCVRWDKTENGVDDAQAEVEAAP